LIALLLALAMMMQGPAAGASIEGFVVQAGTSPMQPLSNARLELLGAGEPRVARTDRDGKYLFDGLPAGVYALSATKDGYLRKVPGIPVELKPGQAVKNLLFRMDSAPSVEGVIRDPESNVLSNVMVQALRLTFDSRGRRVFTLFASTYTDDRGIFRLYWLDPGDYFLSATVPPPPLTAAAASVFAPTYFPGFANIDDAKTIQVTRGRDLTGMDFGLVRQAPATLSGFLSSRTRGALPNRNVTVSVPSGGTGNTQYQATTANTAEFVIRGVFPGTYIVSATDGNETGATLAPVRFDRGGRGAADSKFRVDVRIGPGVAVAGRFGNATQRPMDLRAARIQLTEIEEALPQPRPALIGPDGSFVLAAVPPGVYTLGVSGLPGDLYLKNAVFGSDDALEKPFSIDYGPAESNRLGVEIGLDGGHMSGVVFDGNNAPLPGAQVVLLPEMSIRSRLDRFRTAITDQDGRFVLRGIAPGDYVLTGWSHIEPNAYLDAEYMRPYESFATPVRIAPGENPAAGLRAIDTDR
jgi:hypothetical protein